MLRKISKLRGCKN